MPTAIPTGAPTGAATLESRLVAREEAPPPRTNADRTTPRQLAGSVPPLVTSRLLQEATSMSAMQVWISASVLATDAPQFPAQQLEIPELMQMETWS